MYSGMAVSGRTRSRQASTGKPYFEKDNKRRKRQAVEKIPSQEERCSSYTVSNDGDEEEDVTSSSSMCIARRTRSHFAPSKFRNAKSGTISNPLSLDDDEEENETRNRSFLCQESLRGEGLVSLENLTSSSDDERNPKAMTKRLKVSKSREKLGPEEEFDELFAEMEKDLHDSEDEEGIAEFTVTSSKCSLGTKASQPQEKLESEEDFDELWAEMDKVLRSCEDEDGIPEVTMTCLSSKCTFGTKASQPLEKFELEEEFDELCAEMNIRDSEAEHGIPDSTMKCLSSKNPFGTKASRPPVKLKVQEEFHELWAEMDEGLHPYGEDISVQVENEYYEVPRLEGEVSATTRCQRGNHYLRMDDEIGEVCRYCLHVVRDIKDCDPPFCTNRWGKSGGRYSNPLEKDDDASSSDLEQENLGCDDKSSGFETYTSTGTVWDIIPRVKKRIMYDHQQEAFEFLWTNLAGGIVLHKLEEQLDFAGGSGCIISHAPGTGKTFLTIAFLQAFMTKYPNCRPMIISPTNILHTWEKELQKWKGGVPVPFHNLNKPDLSGEESESAMSRLWKHGGRRAHTKNAIRLAKLCSWREATSILGISYTLFVWLARKGSDNMKKALFELPGLLVLDEGHTPRNSRSLVWEALSKVKTKRRIILSGTPFQNNFKELYNTLRLAMPKFAGLNPPGDVKVVDEKRGFRANETKGNLEFLLKSYDKVESDGEKAEIIAKIRNVIKQFVHVHKGTVLQESLPGLRESIVSLIPSQEQRVIFEHLQKLRRTRGQVNDGPSNWFKFEHWMSVASVHPSLLAATELTDLQQKALLERLESSPEIGVKTKFVMDFIRQSVLIKEKILIFSQYIDPLAFLANQIKSRFNWNEGEQMIVIHGKTHEGTRQASIDAFNDPNSKAIVMLASTKTCYEGINLVGASRVLLLDTLWNPSAERQAVSRAYRIGQKKIVYTYRLITAGTWDEQKLCIQAEKDQLSELVFFGHNEAGHCQNISSVGFEDKLLEKMGRKFDTKITKRGVTILLESEE